MRLISLGREDLQSAQWQATITQMAAEFMAEADYPHPFNPAFFFGFWDSVMANKLGEIFIVSKEEKTVGILGAVFTPDVFSGVAQAAESFWFVRPGFRLSRAGLLLWNAYEKASRERNCKINLMVHLDGLGESVLSRMFEKRGYRRAEQTYRKVF